MMQMVRKLSARLILFSLVIQPFIPFKNLGGGFCVSDKIRDSSVMAINNIFAAKDAFHDELESLDDEERELKRREKKIQKEKEKVRALESSFQGIFPSGRYTKDQTNNFLKKLKRVDRSRRLYEEIPEKRSSKIVRNCIIGGLVAVASVALGVVIGRGLSSGSERVVEKTDPSFVEFLKHRATSQR